MVFDREGFLRSIDSVIRSIREEAARIFLVTAFAEVPQWTGMSAGTFLNLASLVNVALSINPVAFKLKYYPGAIPKTPESGASLSLGTESIFTEANGIYYFNMSNSVLQYRLGEFFGSKTRPAPWSSFEKGAQAFINYVRTELPKRIPNAKNFLIKETRTVSADGSIRTFTHRL